MCKIRLFRGSEVLSLRMQKANKPGEAQLLSGIACNDSHVWPNLNQFDGWL